MDVKGDAKPIVKSMSEQSIAEFTSRQRWTYVFKWPKQ